MVTACMLDLQVTMSKTEHSNKAQMNHRGFLFSKWALKHWKLNLLLVKATNIEESKAAFGDESKKNSTLSQIGL